MQRFFAAVSADLYIRIGIKGPRNHLAFAPLEGLIHWHSDGDGFGLQ